MARRPSWRRVALSAALAGLAAAAFRAELSFFTAPDPPVVLDVRNDIRTYADLGEWPAGEGRFENRGFIACPSTDAWAEGWCVPSGAAGSLRYSLPPVPAGGAALARLYFFPKTPHARARLLVFRGGESQPRLRFNHVYLAGDRIDLTLAVGGLGGTVVLQFEGDNPTETPDVILQSLEVRVLGGPLPVAPRPMRMALMLLAFGAALAPLLPLSTLVPLWGILALGFVLRYAALLRVLWLPIDFDVLEYHRLARTLMPFTETGFYSAQFGVREPFFLLVMKTFLVVLGDSETHVRLMSFFCSLAVIGLMYRVAARAFGRNWGWAAALAMAASVPAVLESPRGLRLEVEMVLLLLLTEAAFLARFRSVWWRALVVGLLGGALALTRATYLVTLLPLFAVAFLPRSLRGAAAAGLCVALMIGVQVPHRVSMARVHGSAFWDSSYYGQWHANFEFAGRRPEFPSRDQIMRSVAQGPRVSSTTYLFGMHTLPELAVGTLRGQAKMMAKMQVVGFPRGLRRLTGLDLSFVDAALIAAACAGLLLTLGRSSTWWIPVAFFSMTVPIAFYYDRGMLENYRQTYQAFPFFLLAALAAVQALLRWVGIGRQSRRSADPAAPLRILMVSTHFYPTVGGAERQAQALACVLIARGHAVTVLTSRPAGARAEDILDGVVIHRAIRAEGHGIRYAAAYALSLARELLRRRGQYDVVHAHVLTLDAAVAGWLKPWLGIPVIAKAAGAGRTGDAYRLGSIRFRRLVVGGIRRLDRIVAPSQEVERELSRLPLAPARIVRIANGVDPARFAPAADRAAMRRRLGVGGPLACFTGRLDTLKGLDTLLEAWRSVVARHPAAQLMIVGAGPEQERLRRRTDELALQRHVQFCGEQPDVRPYLQVADLFVLPSLAEGMSNALLEAMACGVACVVTRIGANEEVAVGDGGMPLVPPGDSEALACAVSAVFDDDARARALGTASRRHVEARYALDAVAGQYEALYRELLAPGAPHAG